MSRKRLPEKRSKPAQGAVTSKKVDPHAWSLALHLADGNARRLTRLSETEVLVRRK